MSNSNELDNPLAVISKKSGTSYELTPTSQKSVQPVALLRLSVFAPVAPRERGKRDFEIDASEELSSMELARAEGYTDIKIQGMKLSMSTDFKTWIGIIQAFSKYGFNSETITMPFAEFAKMCGIKSNDINSRTQFRLKESMANIASVLLSFSNKKTGKYTLTHLVHKAVIDPNSMVQLTGDPEMWELYRYDHKVLLSLKILALLPKKEAAQALYTYLESLPSGTLYLSMKRLRERLALSSPIKRQNQIIRNALDDLHGIGYLEFSELKKGREIQIVILKRNAKLKIEGN